MDHLTSPQSPNSFPPEFCNIEEDASSVHEDINTEYPQGVIAPIPFEGHHVTIGNISKKPPLNITANPTNFTSLSHNNQLENISPREIIHHLSREEIKPSGDQKDAQNNKSISSSSAGLKRSPTYPTALNEAQEVISDESAPKTIRNEFKKVATWAREINNDTAAVLRNAKAALQWAKKNNPSDVSSLETWSSITSSRLNATEKYASWSEARHKASLVKEWIEPGVPRASNHVANEWAAQYPSRITSSTSLETDKEILSEKAKNGISKNWSLDDIHNDWATAQSSSWATDDPRYAEIKSLATHYASLQFEEDDQEQNAAQRSEIKDRDFADEVAAGGNSYKKERIQVARNNEEEAAKQRAYTRDFKH